MPVEAKIRLHDMYYDISGTPDSATITFSRPNQADIKVIITVSEIEEIGKKMLEYVKIAKRINRINYN